MHEVTGSWRAGTHRSQMTTLLALLGCVGLWFGLSLVRYDLFPLAGYFFWLFVGMLLLRFVPLLLLTGAILLAGLGTGLLTATTTAPSLISIGVLLLLSVALVLYFASRQRSGLPTPLSEALLADLRDRLTAQGQVPALPAGWSAQSAMVAAYGAGYAGDFMVADLDEGGEHLELVLVDVVGKGLTAAPSALLLAGALSGLIGAIHEDDLLLAANGVLLRLRAEETFATAVHVSVCLTDGSYTIRSAGHPPALRWSAGEREWSVDSSRGLALGIEARPDLESSRGTLGPGDALMFYTDGVVESRRSHLDDRIDWLGDVARSEMLQGLDGTASRIVSRVERGDDDRAVLIIARD